MKKRTQVLLIIGILVALTILAAIYVVIAIIVKNACPQYTVWKIFLIYASGNNIDSLPNLNIVYFLHMISRVFEVITLAIFSSFAFSLILNRNIALVFPEKLVIRRRTSEGSDGQLYLGVLIGNPKKYELFDVECSVNCSYVKEKGEFIKKNSEVVLSERLKRMRNYYRFSFDISGFHKKFWQDYLERDSVCMKEDCISVIISGHANTLGGTFTIEKKYMLSDIAIDLHNPEDDFKQKIQKPLSRKKVECIDWNKFPQYVEAGEDAREKVIAEIRKLAQQP